MDPLEKKRLANERRLKAIQEQKQRNQQNGVIKHSKISFESTSKSEKKKNKNNLKLFDSDEEEDNNNEDMFKIRPQFEGQNGLELLGMSSEFSSRFKLDERFKEDVEPSERADGEASEEKVKNIKILESVLGYQVNEKYPEGKSTNKRQIERFDPDDEKASKYIKIDGISEESETKSRKKNKKEINESKEETIPISKERYIEVTPNLKDLFSSSSSFSLTSKFQSFKTPNDQGNDKICDESNNPFKKTDSLAHKEQLSNKRVKEFGQNKFVASQKARNTFESRNIYKFFITENDSRLKEGVEFFMRPKPLDEIRKEWSKTKDGVMELFRMKKRSYARGFVNKHPTTQGKRSFIKK